MENIQPWCISRQLWWGHQIPAWYGPTARIRRRKPKREAIANALGYYAEQEVITPEQGRRWPPIRNKREGSSRAMKTCSNLVLVCAVAVLRRGWPDDTKDVERYYPTDVLVPVSTIIFLLGRPDDDDGPALHGKRSVSTVYIHALVRDEKGAARCRNERRHDPIRSRYCATGARSLSCAPRRDGSPGPRHQARAATRRGLPQFRDQLWNACRSPR